MTKVERDFMDYVDNIVLNASPESLDKLAEIDRKTQLSSLTFYDVYLHLSEHDKEKILITSNHTKKE